MEVYYKAITFYLKSHPKLLTDMLKVSPSACESLRPASRSSLQSLLTQSTAQWLVLLCWLHTCVLKWCC